jgi:hypothetical protein
MTTRAFLLAGMAALIAMPAAAQVTDYRLPAAPTPTPTPPPIVGPVLGNTPAPRPSPSPTPSPLPTATATAAPTAAAQRITVPAVRASSPAPVQRTVPGGRGARTSPAAVATQPSAAGEPTIVPTAAPTASTATPAPAPAFASPSPAMAAPEERGRSYWPWIVFVFLLGAAGFAALLWLRRRIGPIGPVAVPEIERPRVPTTPAPTPEPQLREPAPTPEPAKPAPVPEPVAATSEPAATTSATEANPLQIGIELRKLTITLMNATLSYRLMLTNGGVDPLDEIAVAADLVGAHSSLPREAQLAGPGTELPQRHRLAGIAPGESGEVTGELRLPLHELKPITQGRAVLFVPLARFRIGARGKEPRCFTLVAGQPSPSGTGAVQPVRLDLGPRIYDGLAGRAF